MHNTRYLIQYKHKTDDTSIISLTCSNVNVFVKSINRLLSEGHSIEKVFKEYRTF